MNKAEKLELNGYIAPVLRSASDAVKTRRVTLYDRETGEVTGYSTGAEALKGLAKVQELEHTVEEGKRPKEIVCVKCGRLVRIQSVGIVPTAMCKEGGCSQATCAGYEGFTCSVLVPKDAMQASRIKRRKGDLYRCPACAKKQDKWLDSCADRLSNARKALKKSPEQKAKRDAAARKNIAAFNTDPKFAEARSEQMRKAWATRRARAAANDTEKP